MRRAYLAIGWGVVLLGATHMFATTRLFSDVTGRALWFFSGGIAMALVGALNVLNHFYGAAAPGLRRVCIAANVVMTIFAAVAGTVNKASVAEFVIVLGLTGGAAAFSLVKRSSLPGGADGFSSLDHTTSGAEAQLSEARVTDRKHGDRT